MKTNSIEWLKRGGFEEWFKKNTSSYVHVDCVDYRREANHDHQIILNIPDDCNIECSSDCSFFGLCNR